MKNRLFENYIREKRMRPEFIVLSLFIFEMLLSFMLFFIGHWWFLFGVSYRRYSFGTMLIIIGIIILINSLRVTYFILRGITKEQKITGKDVIFIDQKNLSFGLWEVEESYIYLFLTEPYIYHVRFLVDTFIDDPYKESWSHLYFNFPTSRTYIKRKDYWHYQDQYLADPKKTDQLSKSNRFMSFRSKKNKHGREWQQYGYYITYEKAQALNRLFDMVSPPVFRIVVNEKQQRLISIHPIEGREYPSEVPELLEKINQMYP